MSKRKIHFPKGEGIKIINKPSDANVNNSIYILPINKQTAEIIILDKVGNRRKIGFSMPDNLALTDILTPDGEITESGNVYLKEQIDNLLKTEKEERVAVDNALKNSIDTEVGIRETKDTELDEKIASVSSRLDNETNSRTQEDGTLNDKIINLQESVRRLSEWKSLMVDEDSDEVINTISDLINAFNDLPEGSNVLELLGKKVNIASIVDNLESELGNVPLSANQGRVLKTKIETLKGLIDTANTELTKKLDKPTANISEPNLEYKYVAILDEQGNTKKMMAGDLGKNFSNADLTLSQSRGHNLNGQNLSFTGGKVGFGVAVPTEAVDVSGRVKADAVILNTNNTSAIANRVRTNGTFLYHANSSALERRLMYADYSDLKGLVEQMSVSEKTEFLKQFSGGFSTQTPSVSVIINPVLVKGGIQNIKIVGTNLSLDPDVSYVRFKKKSDTQVWHSVENYTCLSSNVISANINTELMEVGQAYVFEIKHGLFLYTSVFSIDVVDEFTSVDISNLSWSEVKDAASDTYIQVSRSGNSFNVNNLKSAEPNLRNTVFHRFKSDKILNAGENAIISFGINVNYGAGVFEFPNGDFDNIGIGEYIADETLLVGRSSTIKSYFLGGGKPVNLRLQNNKHIIGGVGTGLIVKKGTQLISILQVENSSLYMEVNLLKDIDLAVEFQAVGRYLGAKNVGTYTLESVYKF